MGISLAEPLEQINLEVGKRYTFHLKDKTVELRVLKPKTEAEAPSIPESDIMLEPWVALPPLRWEGTRLRSK